MLLTYFTSVKASIYMEVKGNPAACFRSCSGGSIGWHTISLGSRLVWCLSGLSFGPLLYTLDFVKIPRLFSKNTASHHLYADDIQAAVQPALVPFCIKFKVCRSSRPNGPPQFLVLCLFIMKCYSNCVPDRGFTAEILILYHSLHSTQYANGVYSAFTLTLCLNN